jgi:hypothetical protein
VLRTPEARCTGRRRALHLDRHAPPAVRETILEPAALRHGDRDYGHTGQVIREEMARPQSPEGVAPAHRIRRKRVCVSEP